MKKILIVFCMMFAFGCEEETDNVNPYGPIVEIEDMDNAAQETFHEECVEDHLVNDDPELTVCEACDMHDYVCVSNYVKDYVGCNLCVVMLCDDTLYHACAGCNCR